MAHVDRIIRACSQNKALRGKRKYLNITTKIFEVQKIPACYLIADAAPAGLLPGLPEAAHYVVQVGLGVIHRAASHSLQQQNWYQDFLTPTQFPSVFG